LTINATEISRQFKLARNARKNSCKKQQREKKTSLANNLKV